MLVETGEKDTYELIGKDPKTIVSKLPAGLYDFKVKVGFGGRKYYFVQKNNEYEDSEIINVGKFKQVKEVIEKSFSPTMREVNKKMNNRKTKCSILIKGKPGTGKTHFSASIGVEEGKLNNALAFIVKKVDDVNFTEIVDKIRIADPGRKIVFIFDEFEKVASQYSSNDLLSFLDGPGSRDDVLVIMTVNEDKNLPPWLMNRSGRIGHKVTFDIRDEEVFQAIASGIIPKDYKDKIDIKKLFDRFNADFDELNIDNLAISIQNEMYPIVHKELTGEEDTMISPIKFEDETKNVEETKKQKTKKQKTLKGAISDLLKNPEKKAHYEDTKKMKQNIEELLEITDLDDSDGL